MIQEDYQDIDINKVCCINCRYFECGNCFCRYNPPVPMIVSISEAQITTSNFPRIRMPGVDWCGKFENKRFNI